MDNVGRLRLGEYGQLCEALEQLAAFDELRNDVVVVVIFDQIHDTDDVGVRLLAKDGELVLEKLYIDLLFFDLFFDHYLNGKFEAGRIVDANENLAESTLS